MNMNDTPTADQWWTLIAPINDQTGHNIVWNDKSGVVHVDILDVDIRPITFEKKHQGDMLVRFPTLDQRKGYVELEVAVNDNWTPRLLREVVPGWAERETGTVHYLGSSLVQGLVK